MAAANNELLLCVLHHPLRRRLLRLYIESEEPLSPKELSDFTRQPLSNVGYHVRALSEHGAVELVETQPRRGSVEHFYKATSLVPTTPWTLASLGLSLSDK
jgi:DNA-binding transcriptional ArsR family regulator